MAENNSNLLMDGMDDFLGGQDASKIPDRIPVNCYAAGVNVSVKRGSLQPRWGWDKKKLTFEDGVYLDNYKKEHSYKEVYESCKFQAVIPYFIGDTQYIIEIIAGRIFLVNPKTYLVTPIFIDDGSYLNGRVPRLNWTVAGYSVIVYDFPAYPVIIEGTTARRADPALMEIPVSTMGAFNQNRLFVSNSGNEFTGGDPVGNILTPNAPLTFEEVFTVGSPYFYQVFKLPTVDHNDPIVHMGFLQVTDTSTGIGPLIIGTERAIYSFNTQNSRDTWDQGQFGTIICYNAGVVGPRAFANVNSDAFFIAKDGYVRALSMSRDEQHKWSKIPISREAENWFKAWDPSLIKYSFISYFNNKIFFSVNPYRMPVRDLSTFNMVSDYAFGGLVVLELDNLTSFGEATKPTWAGLWTGVRPMDMVNLNDRAFVVAKEGRINALYEINPELTYDTSEEHVRYVRSRIYTREFDFKDPFFNKELHSIDFNFDTLEGDFNIKVEYKPSHGACFNFWREFTHYAPWRTCKIPVTCLINGYAPHHIRDFTFGAPEKDTANPVTNELLKVFRKVQLCINLKGKYWEIHEIRIKATPRLQSDLQTISEAFKAVEICNCCFDDWDVEAYESCQTQVT